MRPETKLAFRLLLAGLFVGAVRAVFAYGGQGLTLLVGTVFCTAVLWAMLALRSLANDKPPGPELDDGLTCTAASAWIIAAFPFRESTFLPDGATDDFALVYLPVSLGIVFATLAAQALWPRREERLVVLRLLATASPGFLLLAGLVRFVAGGPGAETLALGALAAGAVTGGVSVALARRWR